MFLEELTERMTEDWTEVYFTEGYRFKRFHACVVGFWKDLEKTRSKKNTKVMKSRKVDLSLRSVTFGKTRLS